jgi:hypothetical protein
MTEAFWRYLVVIVGLGCCAAGAGRADEGGLDAALKHGDITRVLKILGPAEAESPVPPAGPAVLSSPDGNGATTAPPASAATLEINVPAIEQAAALPRRRTAFLPNLFRRGNDDVEEGRPAPVPESPEGETPTAIETGDAAGTPPSLQVSPAEAPSTPSLPAPEEARPREAQAQPASGAIPLMTSAAEPTVPDGAGAASSGDQNTLPPAQRDLSADPSRTPEDPTKASQQLEQLVASMPEVNYTPVLSIQEAASAIAIVDPRASAADDDLTQAQPLGVGSPVVRSVPSRQAGRGADPSMHRRTPEAMQGMGIPRFDPEAPTVPGVEGGLRPTSSEGAVIRPGDPGAGWKYEGQWNNGAMDGQGTITYPDGWRYEGEWRNGQISGVGTLYHPDGWTYRGEWRNGRMDGRGTLTYPDGWVYVGEWREGHMHGEGELIHPTTASP